MTGEFGATAWGHDWLRLAEPTTITRPDPSLPRARSLTRNNHARILELGPGQVTARVVDHGEHNIHISVPTWNHDQLAVASDTLTASAAGTDLPDLIHAALRDAGLTVAPEPPALRTSCTCTSRKNPCPHLLATYFELARHLDERPRDALVLHGLTTPAAPPATARIPLSLIDPVTFYGETEHQPPPR